MAANLDNIKFSGYDTYFAANLYSTKVIEILKATTVGDSIVSDYMFRNEAYVTKDERMEIVLIMVHHLSKLSFGLYPPYHRKPS